MAATINTNHRITDHVRYESVIVRAFADSKLGSRLMSMGILPGTLLTIEKIAPFRGGYCIKTLSGLKLALRFKEAQSIIVD